ncbi:ABC transporter permease subunit [Phytoactinopolyspora sp. XMNu-373]|uniref:ABC transporter permease subunit n=2 Tax=Phytoactinopolyspora mesophila TaxID=2650750 RepID=A0A7K3LWY3_9ACTN|nr:ABC transporter permease subunit [Phytoactinopolyspora mesophila]
MALSGRRRIRRWVAVVLVAVPGVLAVVGPIVSDRSVHRGLSFSVDDGPLGTDFAGRDVLAEVLHGGAPIVMITLVATVCAYVIALPLGLVAAMSGRRFVDEVIMRPLDLLLAIPSLLLLILLATLSSPGMFTLVAIVVVILAPDATRVVRAAALSPASSAAFEAMVLQNETWTRKVVEYVGRSILRVILADSGVRFIGALYLVASASFLGVGVDPDAANWGVMVNQNKGGLMLQPAGTVVPAALIVSLAVGLNLLVDEVGLRSADRATHRLKVPQQPPGGAARPAGPSRRLRIDRTSR